MGIALFDTAGGACAVDGEQARPVEVEEGERVSRRKALTRGARGAGT